MIDLFLTPYLTFDNGDKDRIGVVINPGTFTNEGYRIYCLMIFRFVKGITYQMMRCPQRKTRRKPRHDSVSWTSGQEKCRDAGETLAFSVGERTQIGVVLVITICKNEEQQSHDFCRTVLRHLYILLDFSYIGCVDPL